MVYLPSLSGLRVTPSAETFVIAKAKERLEAWAKHEKKTLIYVDGEFDVVPASKSFISLPNKTEIGMIVVVVSAIGLTSILATTLFLRKKKEQ